MQATLLPIDRFQLISIVTPPTFQKELPFPSIPELWNVKVDAIVYYPFNAAQYNPEGVGSSTNPANLCTVTLMEGTTKIFDNLDLVLLSPFAGSGGIANMSGLIPIGGRRIDWENSRLKLPTSSTYYNPNPCCWIFGVFYRK